MYYNNGIMKQFIMIFGSKYSYTVHFFFHNPCILYFIVRKRIKRQSGKSPKWTQTTLLRGVREARQAEKIAKCFAERIILQKEINRRKTFSCTPCRIIFLGAKHFPARLAGLSFWAQNIFLYALQDYLFGRKTFS